MKPTELLKNEHRVIERVLDCLETVATRCESRGRLERDAARDILDFLRSYADTCHHGKEEEHLFALLEQRGFSAGSGPVAVMRFEHEQGRELIHGMARAMDGAGDGEADACDDFIHNARSYAALLRAHIQKEDHCLFPMADQALSDADQATLAESFERVDRDEIGAETIAKNLRLAEDLARRFDRAETPTRLV